jgi:hypothetical integral membrane protein (TIGR02206 family)
MRTFFDYRSPYRTENWIELSRLEFFLPILLIITFVILLYSYRNIFKSNELLDKRVRWYGGLVFTIIYGSHYVLRFLLYGFDTIVLPFQLSSISMFLAIILLFTKNKSVYTFVLYAGVLGGLISLATPIIGYDSGYYRYYQFYIAHGLLIITPIYFMFVHNYFPTKKDVINAFWILQGLIVFMGVFNVIFGTDFMFVFLDPSKIDKFPVIQYFGGIPWYIVPGEIAVFVAFYSMYKITEFIRVRIYVTGELKYKEV